MSTSPPRHTPLEVSFFVFEFDLARELVFMKHPDSYFFRTDAP